MMTGFPGEFLSLSWWLWVASGVACLGLFVGLWQYYRIRVKRGHARITRTMAVVWATVVTLPGLVFTAGALWAVLQMIRVQLMS